jgi:enolase
MLMTASDKISKLNELKKQLFILEMKDNFTSDDWEEFDRLRNEINKIMRGEQCT